MAKVAAEELREMVQVLGPEEALGALKVHELRSHCKRFRLKPEGVKLDMVRQLGVYVTKAALKEDGVKPDAGPLAIAEAGAASSIDPPMDKSSDETDLETVLGTPRAKRIATKAGAASPVKADGVPIRCPAATPTTVVAEVALAMANVAAEELREMVQVLGPEEALGALKVCELRSHCKRFGLKPGGVKLDMVRQLGAYVMKATLKEDGVKPDAGPLAIAAAGAASSVCPRMDNNSEKTDLETVLVTPRAKRIATKTAVPSPEKTDSAPITCPAATPTTDVAEVTLAAPTAPATVLRIAIALGHEETLRMLQGLTVHHLREHCRSLGLTDIGKKADLVCRLSERLKGQLKNKMHEGFLQCVTKDSLAITRAVHKHLGQDESVTKGACVSQQYSKTKMQPSPLDAGQGIKRHLVYDPVSFHEPQSVVKRACVTVNDAIVSDNRIESRPDGIAPDETHQIDIINVRHDSCMEALPEVGDNCEMLANKHVKVDEHAAITNDSEQRKALSGEALMDAYAKEHDGMVLESLSTGQPGKAEEPTKEDEPSIGNDDASIENDEESIWTLVEPSSDKLMLDAPIATQCPIGSKEDAMMVVPTMTTHTQEHIRIANAHPAAEMVVDSQAVAPHEIEEPHVVESPMVSEAVGNLKRRLTNRLWLGAARLVTTTSISASNGSCNTSELVHSLNAASTSTPQREALLHSNSSRFRTNLMRTIGGRISSFVSSVTAHRGL